MTNDVSAVIDRLVRAADDWPEPGVTFRDITPLLADAGALASVVEAMVEAAVALGPVDVVAGLDARGFLFGPAIAIQLGVGFVPIRKAGRLPSATHAASYDLEYGSATLEIHRDALAPGQRVLLVDDVLATGGTMAAAIDLVRQAGGVAAAALVLIELTFLDGRSRVSPVACASLHRY